MAQVKCVKCGALVPTGVVTHDAQGRLVCDDCTGIAATRRENEAQPPSNARARLARRRQVN